MAFGTWEEVEVETPGGDPPPEPTYPPVQNLQGSATQEQISLTWDREQPPVGGAWYQVRWRPAAGNPDNWTNAPEQTNGNRFRNFPIDGNPFELATIYVFQVRVFDNT